MRKALGSVLLLAVLLGGALYGAYVAQIGPWRAEPVPADDPPAIVTHETPQLLVDSTLRDVVPPNRSSEVQPGFRGELHPLLFGQTNRTVSAAWEFTDSDGSLANASKMMFGIFRYLSPAVPTKTYPQRA